MSLNVGQRRVGLFKLGSLKILKLFVKYHIKGILMDSAKGIQSLVFEELPFPQNSCNSKQLIFPTELDSTVRHMV